MPKQDLITLERLGERLISSFARLIQGLPESGRGISGMARHLRVHKATCQRVVEGATKCDQGLSAFVRFPGVEALRGFLKACRKKGVEEGRIEACEAAVARWEQELDERGLSQRGLVDLIASIRAGTRAGAELSERRATEQRRALYGAARRLTGEDVEAKVTVGFLERIDERRSGRTYRATLVSALLGARRESFARPIAPFIISDADELREGEPVTQSVRHGFTLLTQFSTTGLKAVKVSESDRRMLLVVDAESAGGSDAAVDVAVMFTTEFTLPEDARLSAAARIVQPTQTLVHDVYLSGELAREAKPMTGCFALTAPPGDAPGGGPDECWYDRFPDGTRPERIPARASGENRKRGPEATAIRLAAHVRQLRGISEGADCRGFRTIVRYPVWQSEYRMYL